MNIYIFDENKISEESFMGSFYKVYKVSEEYGVCNIINSLLDNGLIITSVNIKQEEDIGGKVYQGTYDVNLFINNIYDELQNYIDCSFEIKLQNDIIEKLTFYPNSSTLVVISYSKNFEVTDILNNTKQLD